MPHTATICIQQGDDFAALVELVDSSSNTIYQLSNVSSVTTYITRNYLYPSLVGQFDATLDTANNQVLLELSGKASSNLEANGRYYWGVCLNLDSGQRKTIAEGILIVAGGLKQ